VQQTELDFNSLRVDLALKGDDYDPVRDAERLRTQVGRIYILCRDGKWRTVRSISKELEETYHAFFPENSVQAQLRNLRKLGVTVERRRISDGLSEYRLVRVVRGEKANEATGSQG
jgi:hypothetical protein